jgi:hypothetical protein
VSLTFTTASSQTVFPLIRDLRLRAFPELVGTEAETEEFFRWKFQGRPSHVFVASLEDGRPVGAYSAIEYKYLLRGRPVRVALVVDVLTDPSIRKQGVFTRLGQYAMDGLKAAGCDFTTGYPIRPEVLPGHLKVGWKVNHVLPLYMSPVRCEGLLPDAPRALAGRLEAVGALAARVMTRSLSTEARLDSGLEWVDTGGLLAARDYAAFLEAWQQNRAFVLGEGPDFYRWRYSAPKRSFRHLLLRSGHRLVGVISTRVMPLRGVPGLAIGDIQLLPEAAPLLRPAWRFLWRTAWNERLAVLALMAPPALARAAGLFGLPFLRTHLHFKLITRDLNSAAPDVSRDPDLKLMWVDTDDV